jgi:hypothetical protein
MMKRVPWEVGGQPLILLIIIIYHIFLSNFEGNGGIRRDLDGKWKKFSAKSRNSGVFETM